MSTTQHNNDEPQACLLTIRDVMARTRLCRSSIYSLMADGRLPRPIKLGRRCVRWRSVDIDAAIALVAEQ